jgi:ankyrin repeat protein
VVERLLELGANTRLIDQKRNTCLHLAIANDHIDLALMLIERGCDIDPKNNVSCISYSMVLGCEIRLYNSA